MAEADAAGHADVGVASRRLVPGRAGPLLTPVGRTGFPGHGDVHLRIWLGGMIFDYRATAIAVYNLINDWHRRHWCTIELILHTIEECPPKDRLPNERLFLGQ